MFIYWFQCYLDWFNDSVNAHANKKIDKAAPIAMQEVMKKFGSMKIDLNDLDLNNLPELFHNENPNEDQAKDSSS